MRRIQLLEIEDQKWCLNSIRDAITDCLQYGYTLTNIYKPIFPILKDAVIKSGTKNIIDLGSGGGGPWPELWHIFDKSDIQISLADKYPNLIAFKCLEKVSNGKISFHKEAIDTVNVPDSVKGFRTIFSGFHHFKPGDARTILQNAVDSGQGIGIFESTSRHPLSFLIVLGMPFFMLLFCPFMRPFRLSRLFWTYIIPLAPIIGFLDGIVSCLRTYSCREMTEMSKSLSSNNFNWEIGRKKGTLLGAPIHFMIGTPKHE